MLKDLANRIVTVLDEFQLPHGVNYKARAEVNGKQFLIRTEPYTEGCRDRMIRIEIEQLPEE